jgi:hypothetical protein
MRLIPGPLDAVMHRMPADEAPYNMLIAATSLSAWRKTPPARGIKSAAASVISLAGVMGYP